MTFNELIITRSDLKDEITEYAGKFEFDGMMERPEAEDRAVKIMRERYLIFTPGHLFDGRGIE